jgi:hypothetical protein
VSYCTFRISRVKAAHKMASISSIFNEQLWHH